MRVHVSVTADDIDNGIRRDCWKCPVALALWRATGVKWKVNNYIAFPLGDWDRQVHFPSKVIKFIAEFDAHTFPRPMEFDIEFDSSVVQSKG
jgi:hypothetical protein